VKQRKKKVDYLSERPGESLYAKESREADAILAKERAARKASAKRKRPKT
jgi:hypothetical protein